MLSFDVLSLMLHVFLAACVMGCQQCCWMHPNACIHTFEVHQLAVNQELYMCLVLELAVDGCCSSAGCHSSRLNVMAQQEARNCYWLPAGQG